MEKLHPVEVKKIAVVAAIAILLLAGVIVLRLLRTPITPANQQKDQGQSQAPTDYKTPTAVAPPGVMEVLTDKQEVTVGDSLRASVTIILDGQDGTYSGADAILTFDPAMLTADKVQTSALFLNYPRKTIDNKKGKIIVTGFALGEDIIDGNFFDVQFSAKKSGSTSINIDFAPGSTNLSTIAQKSTGKNILGRVESASITISN